MAATKDIMTSATSGAGAAYPSKESELTHDVIGICVLMFLFRLFLVCPLAQLFNLLPSNSFTVK